MHLFKIYHKNRKYSSWSELWSIFFSITLIFETVAKSLHLVSCIVGGFFTNSGKLTQCLNALIRSWFLPHIAMNQPWIYMCSPSRSPLPPPSPSHPSGPSQCTSPEHLSYASNLDLGSIPGLGRSPREGKARQASLSITNCRSPPKPMSIDDFGAQKNKVSLFYYDPHSQRLWHKRKSQCMTSNFNRQIDSYGIYSWKKWNDLHVQEQKKLLVAIIYPGCHKILNTFFNISQFLLAPSPTLTQPPSLCVFFFPSLDLTASIYLALHHFLALSFPEVITGDMESAMAVDLNPWVEYEFRVVATNPIGTGDPSTPSRMIRTNEAVPKTAPTNVSGRSGRRHELVIAWEPVSEEFQNGEGFGYIVAFRPNGTRGWKEKMVTSSEASKFIYRDESVPPLTPFEVKVGVYNNKGDGPFSQIVVICSAEGEPTAAPTDVKATSMSVSEILVAWKHIKESLGRPQGFEVFYRQEGHSNSQVIETQKPQAVVPLPDAGVYIIEVRAYGEGGDGTASSQIRVPSYSGGKITSAQSALHTLSMSSSVTLLLALMIPSTPW
ncbi:hypothetical protein FD754_011371 [Muntiacus muntjak]|uniref:Fibronectin type-III domain-containing protein n=1 Tax=Muntiacus muntjak TaxID=9888 RepID=A0A5N3VBM1_MUNMU|nr:hypothetical protein FD754_011371 [Muntiacus muntjak]